MALKNARFVHYPERLDQPDVTIRLLTPIEKELLLERILERMGGDRLSDLLAEVASEATKGRADSIAWDHQ